MPPYSPLSIGPCGRQQVSKNMMQHGGIPCFMPRQKDLQRALRRRVTPTKALLAKREDSGRGRACVHVAW